MNECMIELWCFWRSWDFELIYFRNSFCCRIKNSWSFKYKFLGHVSLVWSNIYILYFYQILLWLYSQFVLVFEGRFCPRRSTHCCCRRHLVFVALSDFADVLLTFLWNCGIPCEIFCQQSSYVRAPIVWKRQLVDSQTFSVLLTFWKMAAISKVKFCMQHVHEAITQADAEAEA